MPAEITRANLAQSMAMGRKPRKTRDLSRPQDRWGRAYTVWIDRYSHKPVGLIEQNFVAPVSIPMRFLHVPEDAPWRMDLDLVGWARELKLNNRDWEDMVEAMGRKLYSDRWDVVKKESKGDMPADILQATGPRPLSPTIPILMHEGDPFLLGFTKRISPAVMKADPNFVKSYQEQLRREQRARMEQVNPRKQAVPTDLMLPPDLQELVEAAPQVVRHQRDEEDALRSAHERRAAMQKARELEEEDDDDLTPSTAEDLDEGEVNYAGVPVGSASGDEDDDLDLSDEELENR